MQFRGKYPNPAGELNWDVWFLLLSHLTWHNYAFSRVDRTFVYPQTHFRSFAHMQKAHIELAQNVRYSHGSRVIQNALQRSKILIATHFSVCLVLVAVVFPYQNWKSNSFAHWHTDEGEQTVNANFNLYVENRNSCKISYWTDFGTLMLRLVYCVREIWVFHSYWLLGLLETGQLYTKWDTLLKSM